MFEAVKRIYLLLIFASVFGCLVSSQNSVLSVPTLPEEKIRRALVSIPSSKLINISRINSNANTSDRMLSPIYLYRFDDFSRILAVNVRVKKKDDFKLETYGLLAKGVKQIYLENSRLLGGPPFSLYSVVDNKPVYQSCIIPGSQSLNDIDVRLVPLTSLIAKKSNNSRSILSRFSGLSEKRDYSCIVVTFFTDGKISEAAQLKKWTLILTKLQKSLASN
jgi:hypothetical protein